MDDGMSKKRKRSLNAALAPLMTEATPTSIRAQSANSSSWQELSEIVQGTRAAAFRHQFAVNDKWYTLDTLHTHGDFKTNLRKSTTDSDVYELEKHNISTKTESRAEKLPALVTALGPNVVIGASNTMRVVKGTHKDFQLNVAKDAPLSTVGAAVELGAEIGISEYSRGREKAVLNAMSALYLMKHKRMAGKDFSDWGEGYYGAGKGGAERARNLSEMEPSEALHLKQLNTHFDEVASKKPGKAWSAPTGKKAWSEKKRNEAFETWLVHKSQKWLQRTKK